jgi:deazaflavin-dependent oxidoreductase (nitroreductase family)
MPAYAVIEHRGRRSGRVYATPVAARPITGGFVVPMAFGEQADWFRNVVAAGECVIRWNGTAYHVIEPEIVDWATARQALNLVERMLAPLFANQFVRLRNAPVRADSDT